jgi:hypothetical protein
MEKQYEKYQGNSGTYPGYATTGNRNDHRKLGEPGIIMGVLQRIFRSDKPAGQDMALAHQVVMEYANFVNTSAPLPGCVADSSQLPYDKEVIKRSLFTCISGTGDREIIEHFKNGYLMLSAWQDAVGEQTLGLDFTGLDLEADPLDVAEQIQLQGDRVARWKPVIEAEQKILAADLVSFGV